jgi:hypothetical protein
MLPHKNKKKLVFQVESDRKVSIFTKKSRVSIELLTVFDICGCGYPITKKSTYTTFLQESCILRYIKLFFLISLVALNLFSFDLKWNFSNNVFWNINTLRKSWCTLEFAPYIPNSIHLNTSKRLALHIFRSKLKYDMYRSTMMTTYEGDFGWSDKVSLFMISQNLYLTKLNQKFPTFNM